MAQVTYTPDHRSPPTTWLTEDQVADAVAAYLEAERWRVMQKLGATQRRYDISPERDGTRLAVEAKGGDSSQTQTSRFGQPFNRNQAAHTSPVARHHEHGR